MSEIEVKAIEAILHNNSLLDELGLLPHDFTDRDNRAVFCALSELINDGVHGDVMSLYNSGKVDASLATRYEPITGANGKYYADLIKESTKLRQIDTLQMMVGDLREAKKDSNEIIGEIEKELYKIQERKDNEVRHVKEYLHPAVTEIEAAFNNGGRITGIETGYSDLDNYTNGFHGGEIIILAARTSIGKTAFAINMATNMGIAGINVVFFSCEMSGTQLAKRMLSSVGNISHKSCVNGNVTEADFTRMSDAGGKLYNSALYLDDTPNISFHELRSKARIMKRKGMSVMFIDYLTLVRYGSTRTPRAERVGQLVKEIKELSRQLDVPIIVLSQLNREAEGQKPTLAELRQSGELEEDADIVLFLHRKRGDSDTELIIAKHRNGATGECALDFNEQTVTFKQGVNKW